MRNLRKETAALEKHRIKDGKVSRVGWENLEGWVREKIQELLQAILEARTETHLSGGTLKR